MIRGIREIWFTNVFPGRFWSSLTPDEKQQAWRVFLDFYGNSLENVSRVNKLFYTQRFVSPPLQGETKKEWLLRVFVPVYLHTEGEEFVWEAVDELLRTDN